MTCGSCGIDMVRLNPEDGSLEGQADWRPIFRCNRCQTLVISAYRPQWKLNQEQERLSQVLSLQSFPEQPEVKQEEPTTANPIPVAA